MRANITSWLLYLSLIIMSFSIMDVALDMYARFQLRGLIIPSVPVLLMIIILIFIFRPVINHNVRGTTLLESIHQVGLLDIENRDDDEHKLPPSKLFDGIHQDIIILTYSAYTLISESLSMIEKLLDDGIRVRLLLLYPNDDTVKLIHGIVDWKSEILHTIDVLKSSEIYDRRGFYVKFLRKPPPYTAVLIDGDIDHFGTKPSDTNAQIRVLPQSMYLTEHKGIVIHLRKTKGNIGGVFEYFAQDLRHIWDDGEDCPELFSTT